MITLGKHSYSGNIHERFDPIVEVGNFTSISSDVYFYGTCRHPQTISTFPFNDKGWSRMYPKSYSKGKIVIGSDVWIGEHAKIMDGVTIGDGAIIGMGAMISKDVSPYAVVVGNPQQVIKYRFPLEERQALIKLKWWNEPDGYIRNLVHLMSNPEDFFKDFI